MAQIKEKRRRRRIDVALPIKIAYNNQRITSETKNISVLGTYLETEQTIPVGEALEITIKIAKNKLIICQGIVFRCQAIPLAQAKVEYGIGIFFRSFAKNGETDLSGYIEYMLQEEKKRGKIYVHKRKLRGKGGKGESASRY